MSGTPDPLLKEWTAFEDAKLMMLSTAELQEKCRTGARRSAALALQETFGSATASAHPSLVDALEKELAGGLNACAYQHTYKLRNALHIMDKENQKIILGALNPGKTNDYILGPTRSVIQTVFQGANIDIKGASNEDAFTSKDYASMYWFHSSNSARGPDVPFWDTPAHDEEMAREKLFRVIARLLHAELEFNEVDPEQDGLVRGAYAEVLPNTLLVALTNYSQRLLGLLMPFDLEHLANITPETKRYTSDLTAFSESMSVEQRIALINMTVNAGKVKIHSYDVAAIKASITPQWPAVEEKIKTIEASLLASEVAMQSSNPHVSLDW